jgi:hypothetical protein
VELQSRAADWQKGGLGLAAISYDSTEVLKSFADRKGITFPLLSDPGSEIIKRYGLLNPQFKPGEREYGVPHPGTFILDRQGKVVSRFFEDRYDTRYTVASIATQIGSGASLRDAVRHDTKFAEITAYVSDALVAPGNRFSLVVDVKPKPGLHFYAPGQEGYRGVALAIHPDPSLAVRDGRLPEPEWYTFAPLNERVKVYQKPFRLIQDVSIPVTRETRQMAQAPDASLAIKGVFEYQACDDERCFLPQSLPVSWTVRLRPLEGR